MKLTNILFIFMVLASVPHLASASTSQSLLQCAKISNDINRLKCFDDLTNKLQAEVPKLNVSEKKAPVLTNIDKKTTTNPIAELPTSENDAVQNFGKQKKEASLKSFKSRIVGKLTGWKKGTKFKLENGQIWKVRSSNKVYTKLNNPEIVISKAVFGSFSAKIEGVTAIAKVSRVK